MEAYHIPNKEASTMAKVLVDQLLCQFSVPEQLHSDQRRQFESETEVCGILRIRKTCTTPYHPQCDRLVECCNRTLLDMLATTTKNHQFDGEEHISKVCTAYNSTT